jgi:hypothetical protein
MPKTIMSKSSKTPMITILMTVDSPMKISGISKMTIEMQMLTRIAEDSSSKPSTSNKIGKMRDSKEVMWTLEAYIPNTLRPNKNLMILAMNASTGLRSTKERNLSKSPLKELLKKITKGNLSLDQPKEKIL